MGCSTSQLIERDAGFGYNALSSCHDLVRTIESLDTGDIILFRGRGGVPYATRLLGACFWDHVGIVIRREGHSRGDLPPPSHQRMAKTRCSPRYCTCRCTSREPRLEVLESTRQGVHVYKLEERLARRLNHDSYTAIRRLKGRGSRDKEQINRLIEDFVAKVSGAGYPGLKAWSLNAFSEVKPTGSRSSSRVASRLIKGKKASTAESHAFHGCTVVAARALEAAKIVKEKRHSAILSPAVFGSLDDQNRPIALARGALGMHSKIICKEADVKLLLTQDESTMYEREVLILYPGSPYISSMIELKAQMTAARWAKPKANGRHPNIRHVQIKPAMGAEDDDNGVEWKSSSFKRRMSTGTTCDESRCEASTKPSNPEYDLRVFHRTVTQKCQSSLTARCVVRRYFTLRGVGVSSKHSCMSLQVSHSSTKQAETSAADENKGCFTTSDKLDRSGSSDSEMLSSRTSLSSGLALCAHRAVHRISYAMSHRSSSSIMALNSLTEIMRPVLPGQSALNDTFQDRSGSIAFDASSFLPPCNRYFAVHQSAHQTDSLLAQVMLRSRNGIHSAPLPLNVMWDADLTNAIPASSACHDNKEKLTPRKRLSIGDMIADSRLASTTISSLNARRRTVGLEGFSTASDFKKSLVLADLPDLSDDDDDDVEWHATGRKKRAPSEGPVNFEQQIHQFCVSD